MRQGASDASVRQTSHATLEALAARVAGLHLSFADPETFHLEKHSLASELRALARRLGRAG